MVLHPANRFAVRLARQAAGLPEHNPTQPPAVQREKKEETKAKKDESKALLKEERMLHDTKRAHSGKEGAALAWGSPRPRLCSLPSQPAAMWCPLLHLLSSQADAPNLSARCQAVLAVGPSSCACGPLCLLRPQPLPHPLQTPATWPGVRSTSPLCRCATTALCVAASASLTRAAASEGQAPLAQHEHDCHPCASGLASRRLDTSTAVPYKLRAIFVT